ncbi:MAG: hypothetical protein KBT39_09130 [Bacteroidales bacterium]|nr:hypothetical protein [Bacteroidales bacterium]
MEMKRIYKSDVAEMAGVSYKTFQRWMAQHRTALQERGVTPQCKFITPLAMEYIRHEYYMCLN